MVPTVWRPVQLPHDQPGKRLWVWVWVCGWTTSAQDRDSTRQRSMATAEGGAASHTPQRRLARTHRQHTRRANTTAGARATPNTTTAVACCAAVRPTHATHRLALCSQHPCSRRRVLAAFTLPPVSSTQPHCCSGSRNQDANYVPLHCHFEMVVECDRPKFLMIGDNKT